MKTDPSSIARCLTQYLDAVASTAGEFNWSRNNCCHFAGRWVMHATGVDPLSGLADVADALDALRVIRSIGAKSLAGAVEIRLGRQRISPERAQVGDIVMAPGMWTDDHSLGGTALGICAGRTAVFIDLAGVTRRTVMAKVSFAWPLFDRDAETARSAA